MPNASLANISSLRFAEQAAAPGLSVAGFSRTFMKADGLYIEDDSGVSSMLVRNTPATAAQNTIVPSANVAALTLKAFSDSTLEIFDVQRSTGNSVFRVEDEGQIDFGNSTDVEPVLILKTPAANNHYLYWLTDDKNRWELATDGAEGGSNVGTDLKLASFNDAGSGLDTDVLFIKRSNSRISLGNVSPQARFHVDGSADEVQLRVDGHSSQTAFIAEWRDSGGGIHMVVDKDGYLGFKEEAGAPTATADYCKMWGQSDNKLRWQDGDGNNHIVHGNPIFLTEVASTQGLGANPDIYLFGFYEFSAADANLDEGSTTQAFGDANVSHAGRAFIVPSGAGAAASGTVEIRVTGTSITDAGSRTPGDNETLIADITGAVQDTYYETTKKWLGVVTFELNITAGAPATYSLDFNYGLTNYERCMENDFTVDSVHIRGLAGAADNDFDVRLYHHDPDGTWVYSAAAFTPLHADQLIASLVTDHATDDKLAASKHFSWMKTGLSTVVTGSAQDGIIAFISSSANNAIEYMNMRVGVEY